eukprot:TRINITY_DN5590_c0_g1_i1.p1 TRINITY_DN5590_c0_g1~~TRINITY_DN5590_c0_g1_i1.p1  ORF type:complete len:256 (-),score=40.82 TRINITY_DN5590_c0_g1_i1:8-775(-)
MTKATHLLEGRDSLAYYSHSFIVHWRFLQQWRIFCILYMTSVLLADIILHWSNGTILVQLSEIAWFTSTLYFTLTIAFTYTIDKDLEHRTPKWYVRGLPHMYTVALSASILVTIAFWTFMRPSPLQWDFFVVNLHMVNLFIMLVETLLSRLLVEPLHVISVLIFAVLYAALMCVLSYKRVLFVISHRVSGLHSVLGHTDMLVVAPSLIGTLLGSYLLGLALSHLRTSIRTRVSNQGYRKVEASYHVIDSQSFDDT